MKQIYLKEKEMPRIFTLMILLLLSLTVLSTAQPFGKIPKVGSDNERYVSSLYRDIQDREGDPKGIEYWTDQLNNKKPRADVVRTFLTSEEYRARFVTRIYGWFHDRKPDVKGLKYWVDLMKEKTERDIIKAFCISDEFWKNSNENNKDFVTNLYWTLQSREPDPNGLKYWVEQLIQGKTREFVVDSFLKSNEFLTKYINFVYDWYLERKPDTKGLEYWKGVLKEKGEREVIILILSGEEYWNKATKPVKK
jgi:hypothetical protein